MNMENTSSEKELRKRKEMELEEAELTKRLLQDLAEPKEQRDTIHLVDNILEARARCHNPNFLEQVFLKGFGKAEDIFTNAVDKVGTEVATAIEKGSNLISEKITPRAAKTPEQKPYDPEHVLDKTEPSPMPIEDNNPDANSTSAESTDYFKPETQFRKRDKK